MIALTNLSHPSLCRDTCPLKGRSRFFCLDGGPEDRRHGHSFCFTQQQLRQLFLLLYVHFLFPSSSSSPFLFVFLLLIFLLFVFYQLGYVISLVLYPSYPVRWAIYLLFKYVYIMLSLRTSVFVLCPGLVACIRVMSCFSPRQDKSARTALGRVLDSLRGKNGFM